MIGLPFRATTELWVMRDELYAANRTQVEGTRLRTQFRFGALQSGQESVAKFGGRLSGEFSESISLIAPASQFK